MIDRALLQRIRKCLALSASSNEHEAAAALAKARDLMREHGISDTDLAMAEIEEKAARTSRRESPPEWEVTLASAVERALSVTLIVDYARDFLFIGHGPSAEIAAYAFTALHRRLKAARAEYIKRTLRRCTLARKRARADAFYEGWANVVYGKIARLAPGQPDDAAIRSYIAKRFGSLATCESRSAAGKRTDEDYFRGARAGRDVDLHHGMAGAADQAKISA